MSDPRSFALYVHWPFCVSKCPYCDFNSHVAASVDHQAWRDAYVQELKYYANLLPGRTVSSIFFGGGTPSLMEPHTVSTVLESASKFWRFNNDIEITLEANPSSAESDKFKALRKVGVNRLSLGVQSLRDADLKFLGRAHNVEEAKKAIALAAKAFPRFSFDLIYARRGQSLKSWEEELKEGLALAEGHLSLYQLTLEPNTQFYNLARRGEVLTLPDEESATMYEHTQELLEAAGYPAYEISNHAIKGQESLHNLTYWRYEDYAGIGPGAHGRLKINGKWHALDNHKAPEHWMREVGLHNNGLRQNEVLTPEISAREAIMMGLRLTEGLSQELWFNKFERALPEFFPRAKVEHLKGTGFLVEEKEHLRATKSGLQRLNAVLDYLLN